MPEFHSCASTKLCRNWINFNTIGTNLKILIFIIHKTDSVNINWYFVPNVRCCKVKFRHASHFSARSAYLLEFLVLEMPRPRMNAQSASLRKSQNIADSNSQQFLKLKNLNLSMNKWANKLKESQLLPPVVLWRLKNGRVPARVENFVIIIFLTRTTLKWVFWCRYLRFWVKVFKNLWNIDV